MTFWIIAAKWNGGPEWFYYLCDEHGEGFTAEDNLTFFRSEEAAITVMNTIYTSILYANYTDWQVIKLGQVDSVKPASEE